VIADYHVTEQRMEAVPPRCARPVWCSRATRSSATGSSRAATCSAPPAPRWRGAITHLNDRFGGAAGYLQAHGASPESIARWREILIEPGRA